MIKEEEEIALNDEQNNNSNEDIQFNSIDKLNKLIEEEKIFSKKNIKDTGFYDKKYYEKLELIDLILKFIDQNFKMHYPPNENIILGMPILIQLKELIEILFSYFNVLPPMQKKCIDKNINDLMNYNEIKKSVLAKKILFIERDIKKAKYNLISKKDLYELLKKRGLE